MWAVLARRSCATKRSVLRAGSINMEMGRIILLQCNAWAKMVWRAIESMETKDE